MKRSFSILSYTVTIETNDPVLLTYTEDIAVDTEDHLPCGEKLLLHMESSDGLVRISHNGNTLIQEADPETAVRNLHLLINRLVLEPQIEVLKLHAGAATWRESFFLVTGNRGAGKTTLLLKMMLDGADMHCDETVLLHQGLIQTFPRKFYIKAGTLEHLPRIAEICKTKRSYPGFFGERFHFADPTDLDLPWRSREGLPRVIFHLTPVFDKPPHLETCTKVDMAKHLLFQTINLAGDFGFHVMQICRMLDACRCYSLHVGDLGATAELLKKTLE